MSFLDYSFYFSEILAAISGMIYTKYQGARASRYFVSFLVLTVLLETYGMLSMNFRDWTFFEAYHDSKFIVNNIWLYNIYYVFSYAIYTCFFRSHLVNSFRRNLLLVITIIYFISSFLNLFYSDILFESYSSYTTIFGTLLILLSVFLYFYEMIKSDKILKFYTNIAFYIAVGSTIFHICTSPLFIYHKYFTEFNDDFLNLYYLILPIAIIFMYTCYTLGFIICLPRKIFYQKSKSY